MVVLDDDRLSHVRGMIPRYQYSKLNLYYVVGVEYGTTKPVVSPKPPRGVKGGVKASNPLVTIYRTGDGLNG